MENFLYSHYPSKGELTPESLVFNANLQEFAQRVVYLCGLETNGKITPEEAYQAIRQLWQHFKASQGERLNGQE